MKTFSVCVLMLCVAGAGLSARAQEKKPAVVIAGISHGSRIDYDAPEYEYRKEQSKAIARADALLSAGHVAEARVIYTRILAETKGQPNSSRAIEGLGEVARISDDYRTALFYYDDMMTIKPGQNWITSRTGKCDVRAKYALLLQRAGRYDEAWESYQIAVADQGGARLPKPPAITREQVPTAQFVFAASLTVAATKLDNDDVQGAAFARDAARANPSSGLPHYYLGRLLERNDEAGAKAEYEKAISYGHGEYVERAKSQLAWVNAQLAKPTAIPQADALPKQ